HLRIVQSNGKPADYEPGKDPAFKPLGPTRLRPDGVWDRGGQNFFSSPVHKSATVDYGILLAGERTPLPDPCNVGVETRGLGCAARQLARMEQRQRRQPHGLRHDGCSLRQRTEGLGMVMDNGLRPVRRIVTIDDDEGKSLAIADGPSPDVRADPARPGFSSMR